MRRILSIAAIAAILVVPAVSEAAHCYYAPGDNDDSGDNAYVQLWNNRQDIVDFFWDQYDFDKGDWDDGFGYWDPTNVDQPLAREFNALYALQYSSPDPTKKTDDYGGNILRSGANYAMEQIDELDGRCGNGTTSGTTATTWSEWYQDNRTELYWPTFYGQDVVTRAANVLHESRHAGGKHHVDDSECTRGGSCDGSWEDEGANMYEVLWLWWYYVEAAEVAPGLKAKARSRANDILERGFHNRPIYHVGL